MRVSSRLVRQQYLPAGTKIKIPDIQHRLITGCKVVCHSSVRVQFQEGVSVVCAAGVSAERSIARHEIDVTAGVHRGRTACLPDSSLSSFGSRVERHDLLQRGGVISHPPAVPGAQVAMRSEPDVYYAINQ